MYGGGPLGAIPQGRKNTCAPNKGVPAPPNPPGPGAGGWGPTLGGSGRAGKPPAPPPPGFGAHAVFSVPNSCWCCRRRRERRATGGCWRRDRRQRASWRRHGRRLATPWQCDRRRPAASHKQSKSVCVCVHQLPEVAYQPPGTSPPFGPKGTRGGGPPTREGVRGRLTNLPRGRGCVEAPDPSPPGLCTCTLFDPLFLAARPAAQRLLRRPLPRAGLLADRLCVDLRLACSSPSPLPFCRAKIDEPKAGGDPSFISSCSGTPIPPPSPPTPKPLLPTQKIALLKTCRREQYGPRHQLWLWRRRHPVPRPLSKYPSPKAALPRRKTWRAHNTR